MSPVLIMPDTTKPFRVEVDALNYATGGILSQLDSNGKWHPAAYLSKSMTDTEQNYKIHDKELLAVIRALEAWRHYLGGALHKVEIWTDHRNLEYFQTARNLNRQQARWALFLTRFDFELVHKPGVTNKSDQLSRRSDHKQGTEDNNSNQTPLNLSFFLVHAL